ncbi:hybrid sensor histidine kinase/response regulator [Trinickia mobilis]|uniref:hybrid sensor histidine kinase/response regulator n=1 Tax=Trinickia mobilis TaxID=2816356 RepID=UPI001A8E176A|nr:ATP-binding protein [Trinickia mobilis]
MQSDLPAPEPSPAAPARELRPLVSLPEERFRILVEAVEDYAIFMLDRDGRVTSWNTGAQKIKGYSARQIIGQHFSVFYPPEDIAAGKPEMELVVAARDGRVEDEGWRVRRDGSMFWANVIITAVYETRGGKRELSGFAKVTRDMTERKRLRELEVASQHMNEFLSTLAHELRNPLAPVRNALSVMMLEPFVSPTVKQCRDMIDRQVTHLTRLVDDLLDVGRVTTGKIVLRLEPVDLKDVVARSIEMMRPHLDMRQQAIDVAYPKTRIMVNGDLARLVQITQNLLSNASKFSEPSSRIGVSVQAEGTMAALRVSDRGCGVEPDALESIFDLFVQADSRLERNEGGLGVGLTLCRWLAEMHGGAVTVASAGRGHGATFTLHLPRLDSSPVESEAGGAATLHPNTAGHDDDTLHVLIVDDNRDSADSMAMLMSLKGHRVRVAYNGLQALAIASTERVDVALIDIAMPGADGFTVLRQLKSIPSTNEALYAAMTGFGQASDMERSLQGGFDAHLTKPVPLALIDALLQRALERRSGPETRSDDR